MNGATVEPCTRISNPPKAINRIKIGPSQYFFERIMNLATCIIVSI